MVKSSEFSLLTRGLLGFKSRRVVAAVAKRLVFRLAAATEIHGRELVFLILFTLVIEQLGSALHFVGTVFRYTNDYISHSFLLVINSRPSNSGAEHDIARDGLQLQIAR